MEPSKPCSAPTRSACPPAAAAFGRELHFDLMLEVLLRVPGKDLCRLRAVCQRWRGAVADPSFVAEHAARHRDPLLLVNLRPDDAHVHVVDLSGAVVNRIAIPAANQLVCTRLDLACVATGPNSCRVLDPATGAVAPLPAPPMLFWHGRIMNLTPQHTAFAFWKVAATGEHKVLRMCSVSHQADDERFDVCSVGGGAGTARWRRLQKPDLVLDPGSAVVVHAVVYLLYSAVYLGVLNGPVDPDCIASFDLGTEKWGKDLQGPISSSLVLEDEEDMYQYITMQRRLTLAELKGTLALSYYLRCRADIWFLSDFGNGLWVKEYSIQTESITKHLSEKHSIKPLVVLEDERIAVHLVPPGLLLIYDPRTNSFDQVGDRCVSAVAMYTGSVLSLQYGDMLHWTLKQRSGCEIFTSQQVAALSLMPDPQRY